ncbi:MAG: hypothetical protein JXA24_00125 [Proteobacteria bacterium]|nr:hypothetical protein [Pseudomonadota bacterium]
MLWIKAHWVSAVELVAVGLLVVAVMVGADAYGRRRARSGAEAMFGVEAKSPASEARLAGLERVADDYSRYFAGKRAMMELGGRLLAEGRTAEAKRQFAKLADGSRSQAVLRIAALHRLAETRLAEGDPAAAAEAYRKAAADPGNLIPKTSELMAAACLERAGDFQGAAELYRIIIDGAGEDDRLVRARSEERLLWLAANGRI